MRHSHVQSRPILRAAVAAAAALVAFSTNAQSPPPKLGLCAACHGERGISTSAAIPNLAAQNLLYLRSALQQYKSGARDVPAMRAAVSMLADADAERVLQWYASQPPQSATP
jgi:cytochrome c553